VSMAADDSEVYTSGLSEYKEARLMPFFYPEGTDKNTQFNIVKMPLSGSNAGKVMQFGDYTKGEEHLSINVGERALYAIGWTEKSSGGGGSDSGGGGSSGGGSSSGGGGSSTPAKPAADPATGAAVLKDFKAPEATKPAESFRDVEPNRWSKKAIDFVVTRGIFSGNGDGTFDPELPMSRGMMAQVLYNMAGKPSYSGSTGFKDQDSFLWFSDAIGWSEKMGFVTGEPDGRFNPGEKLTREQAVTILFRFAKAIGLDTGARAELNFPDAGNVRSYAKDAMQWAVAKGLINGDGGMLLPDGSATREQMATIIMRFVELIPKQ